jgi:hypothetical protein
VDDDRLDGGADGRQADGAVREGRVVAPASAQGGSASAQPAVAGRELLEELLRLRLEVRRYGVNVNQIAAAMNAGGGEPPVWLRQVAERGEPTLAAIDEVTGRLPRLLP